MAKPKLFHIRIDSPPGYNSDAMRQGFIENGFDYYGFDWMRYRYQLGTELMRKELLKQIEKVDPKIVFCHVQNPEALDKPTWEAIASNNRISINYTFDVRSPEESLWLYDVAKIVSHSFFSNSRDVYESYAAGCKNVSHMHSSCDMSVYANEQNQSKILDVCFVGNRYDQSNLNFPLADMRESMVEILKKEYGPRFCAYGLGRPGGIVAAEVEAKIYNCSKIAIAQNNFYLDNYTSDRLWKIMASGCFCLTAYFPGIENLFQRGVHLDWFSTLDEMLELCDRYLAANDKRKEIADAGMNCVRSQHNWTMRVSQMLKEIKFKSEWNAGVLA